MSVATSIPAKDLSAGVSPPVETVQTKQDECNTVYTQDSELMRVSSYASPAQKRCAKQLIIKDLKMQHLFEECEMLMGLRSTKRSENQQSTSNSNNQGFSYTAHLSPPQSAQKSNIQSYGQQRSISINGGQKAGTVIRSYPFQDKSIASSPSRMNPGGFSNTNGSSSSRKANPRFENLKLPAATFQSEVMNGKSKGSAIGTPSKNEGGGYYSHEPMTQRSRSNWSGYNSSQQHTARATTSQRFDFDNNSSLIGGSESCHSNRNSSGSQKSSYRSHIRQFFTAATPSTLTSPQLNNWDSVGNAYQFYSGQKMTRRNFNEEVRMISKFNKKNSVGLVKKITRANDFSNIFSEINYSRPATTTLITATTPLASTTVLAQAMQQQQQIARLGMLMTPRSSSNTACPNSARNYKQGSSDTKAINNLNQPIQDDSKSNSGSPNQVNVQNKSKGTVTFEGIIPSGPAQQTEEKQPDKQQINN